MALLALASVGVPPNATPFDFDTSSMAVRYDDLDLNSTAGRARLGKRIAIAVRRVCDDPGLPLAESARQVFACMDAARQQAERDVAQAVASAAKSLGTAADGSARQSRS